MPQMKLYKLTIHYLNDETGEKIGVDEYSDLSPLDAFKMFDSYFWSNECVRMQLTDSSTFNWIGSTFDGDGELTINSYNDLLHRKDFCFWAMCIMKGRELV